MGSPEQNLLITGVTLVTLARNGPAATPLLCLVIGSEYGLGVNATVDPAGMEAGACQLKGQVLFRRVI